MSALGQRCGACTTARSGRVASPRFGPWPPSGPRVRGGDASCSSAFAGGTRTSRGRASLPTRYGSAVSLFTSSAAAGRSRSARSTSEARTRGWRASSAPPIREHWSETLGCRRAGCGITWLPASRPLSEPRSPRWRQPSTRIGLSTRSRSDGSSVTQSAGFCESRARTSRSRPTFVSIVTSSSRAPGSRCWRPGSWTRRAPTSCSSSTVSSSPSAS